MVQICQLLQHAKFQGETGSLCPSDGLQEPATQSLTAQFHLSPCPFQLWCPPFLPAFLSSFFPSVHPKNLVATLSPGLLWVSRLWLTVHRGASSPGIRCVLSLPSNRGVPSQGCSSSLTWGLRRAPAACLGPGALLPSCPRLPTPGHGDRKTCPSLPQRCAQTSLSGVSTPTLAQIPNF